VVISKVLSVLSEPQLLEPSCDVFHHPTAPWPPQLLKLGSLNKTDRSRIESSWASSSYLLVDTPLLTLALCNSKVHVCWMRPILIVCLKATSPVVISGGDSRFSRSSSRAVHLSLDECGDLIIRGRGLTSKLAESISRLEHLDTAE
jgi:hypothetical protein